ncbi:hypothetical protein [Streptomyces sp. C1-2]|uniref:hypothetical protein n=1 Tax=Streptomyces sp. C1-2 TaxID=2720022 RepID=UPI0014326952|nr:hypothetical protein [Streptomyces sp. C1-2]NJP74419.1 hypothetical protein [Streptomyces sp. C1-2]
MEELIPRLHDLDEDPHAWGMVLRILAAAGDGSTNCNRPLAWTAIEHYRRMTIDLSDRKRRRNWERRRDGKSPLLMHEVMIYHFHSLTLLWTHVVAEVRGIDYEVVLDNWVIDGAKQLIQGVQEEAINVTASTLALCGAVASPDGRSADAELISTQARGAAIDLEEISAFVPGTIYDAEVELVMAAASFSIYAGALVSHLG